MVKSQKYCFALGRRVCLLQPAVLLKNNFSCFMPKSSCVRFQNPFMFLHEIVFIPNILPHIFKAFSDVCSEIFHLKPV